MARKSMTPGFSEQDQRTIDAAERDLAALLAIAPSAEFRARVRARIEAAREPQRWRTWSWALATVALAALAAGAVVLMRAGDAAHQRPETRVGRTTPDAAGATPPKPEATKARGGTRESVVSALGRSASRDGRTVAAHAARSVYATEVVVDRAQADAVRQLLAIAGRTPRDTAVELPPDVNPTEISSIPLAPLNVAPLNVPEVKTANEGVEQ